MEAMVYEPSIPQLAVTPKSMICTRSSTANAASTVIVSVDVPIPLEFAGALASDGLAPLVAVIGVDESGVNTQWSVLSGQTVAPSAG
jgi:hypothetical protein